MFIYCSPNNSRHQPDVHHVANKKQHFQIDIKSPKHSETNKMKLKSHPDDHSKELVIHRQSKMNTARRNGPRKVLLDELMGKQQRGPLGAFGCASKSDTLTATYTCSPLGSGIL